MRTESEIVQGIVDLRVRVRWKYTFGYRDARRESEVRN